jgi:hypothetical protein
VSLIYVSSSSDLEVLNAMTSRSIWSHTLSLVVGRSTNSHWMQQINVFRVSAGKWKKRGGARRLLLVVRAPSFGTRLMGFDPGTS